MSEPGSRRGKPGPKAGGGAAVARGDARPAGAAAGGPARQSSTGPAATTPTAAAGAAAEADTRRASVAAQQDASFKHAGAAAASPAAAPVPRASSTKEGKVALLPLATASQKGVVAGPKGGSKAPGSGKAATAPPASPLRAKEVHVQQLLQEYNEKMRGLTRERQSIMQNQALWTGKVDPDSREGDAQERMEYRARLVQQLSMEQAASEAMVEALKNNKSLKEAQQIAQQVAQELQELRINDAADAANRRESGSETPIGSGLMSQALLSARQPRATFEVDSRPGSLGTSQPYGAPKAAPSGQFPGVVQGDTGRKGPASVANTAASGRQQQQQQQQDGSLPKWPSAAAAAASASAAASAAGTLGAAAPVPGSPAYSIASQMSRHTAVHFKDPPPVTSLISYEPQARSWPQPEEEARPSRSTKSDREPPGYIEELKQQVQALQAAIEQQMAAKQQQQQQPVIVMPPPYYPPPPQQQQPAPAPPQQHSGLPEHLQLDPDVHRAHMAYQKEMALLKMQIEKARGEAELEQIKTVLNQLKGSSGTQDPPRTPEQDIRMTNVESGVDGTQEWEDEEDEADEGVQRRHEDDDDDDDDDTEHDDEIERFGDRPADAGAPAKGGLMFADVLNIFLHMAAPFDKRGTYRIRVVLYDGFQPLSAGPGLVVGASSTRRKYSDRDGMLMCVWNETLVLRGLRLSPTMMLVFELYLAKQAVAGLPSRESIVAWGFTSVLTKGELIQGSQSVALYRLPLMITSQRKFSFNGAMLDFTVTKADGEPGDITSYDNKHPSDGSPGVRPDQGRRQEKEDVPGVPVEAWNRVARGVPPLDPYTPGEGFVLMVDGARFLPANVTISKVVVSLWSSDKRLLVPQYYEAVSLPDSNAYAPRYALQTTLGSSSERFDNATATLLFAVHTICRWERVQRMVGYAALPIFVDPSTERQPASKNVRDYVLNQGAFQIPLHVAPPPPDQPFRGDSLEMVPRLPCASLLVRILSPEVAKIQRRKPMPAYSDRVYDTMRAIPTPVERKLYIKYLYRKALGVREAARLLVMGPRAMLGGRKARMGVLKPSPPPGGMRGTQGTATKSKLNFNLGRLMRGRGSADAGGGEDGEGAAEGPPGHLVAGPAKREDEREEEELEEEEETGAQDVGVLPSTDAELMDWMEDRLRNNSEAPLNYNLSSEYFPDLGFYVAADSAMRLDRPLPSAVLMTFAPPGSFYLDNPVVDDMKATLDYDMSSHLACPRWTDGFQQFENIVYERGLCVIFDVRLLIPTTGASSPAGWAALPVFEKAGPYVATGTYHLPLFQGVPSRFIVQEMASKGDVESVIMAQLKNGRLRVSEDCPSILVRLMDGARQGQVETPAGKGPGGLAELRLPSYISALGPKFLVTMRKSTQNKTYSEAKPKNATVEAWVQELNDCILKVAGLDGKLVQEDEDEDEVNEGEDPEAEDAQTPTPKRKGGSAKAKGGKGKTPPRAPTGGGAGYSTYSFGPGGQQQQQQVMPGAMPPMLPSQPPFFGPGQQPPMMQPPMMQPPMMQQPMMQQPMMQQPMMQQPMMQQPMMQQPMMQQPMMQQPGGVMMPPPQMGGGAFPGQQPMVVPPQMGGGGLPGPQQQPMMMPPQQQFPPQYPQQPGMMMPPQQPGMAMPPPQMPQQQR